MEHLAVIFHNLCLSAYIANARTWNKTDISLQTRLSLLAILRPLAVGILYGCVECDNQNKKRLMRHTDTDGAFLEIENKNAQILPCCSTAHVDPQLPAEGIHFAREAVYV